MRAEAAGDTGRWRQQAILGRGRWDADALRDIVREYALENLAEEEAVLVIDETGFLKQGKAWCGVAPNKQVSRQDHQLADRGIRRIAMKLAQRRIQPARVIARSLWRRAHQAETRRANLSLALRIYAAKQSAWAMRMNRPGGILCISGFDGECR
jgi:hypothetical protein